MERYYSQDCLRLAGLRAREWEDKLGSVRSRMNLYRRRGAFTAGQISLKW